MVLAHNRRLAQAVLAREDPRETFLKAVPIDGGYLEILYPVSHCNCYYYAYVCKFMHLSKS